ncbi:METTL5 family protein [Candidatus Nanohalobium constans]|uniref:Methyltransferase-like protein 5 n=1 Tax=Candidatus Nanohalobium constans TaxID=2565781 RepID=A0A5Q0UF60_9ARCH|nr:methyltransferase [Candidatus Nanohalobium constans]QGA80207.1 putative methylase [Candidatus Nanohalobium constans]
MKNDLKQALSKVRDFEDPKISLEQYITPPALAADLVFTAYMQGDIESKKVADLGTGTGILGIGAELIDGEVVAVEKDDSALELAKENAEDLGANIDFLQSDVEEFGKSVDTVVMNPPFSVHSDTGLDFWEKALEVGDAVYGISPRGARDSIKSLVRSSNHKLEGVQEYEIGLPPSYGFHTEESRETPVDLIITKRST